MSEFYLQILSLDLNLTNKIPAQGTYVDQRGTVKRMVNRLGYFFETGLR